MKEKIVIVNLNEMVEDYAANFRESEIYSLRNSEMSALYNDLAANGQKVPLLIEKGKPGAIQGNRRLFALKRLAEDGVIDPLTMDVDGIGQPIEGTGKPFSTARAVVVENLSPSQRVMLRTDFNRAGLNKVELCNAIFAGFDATMSEIDIVRNFGPLLEEHYPLKKETREMSDGSGATDPIEKVRLAKNKLEAELKERRGVIQSFHRAFDCPYVVQIEYRKKLRKDQAWPVNGDIAKLAAAFAVDQKNDMQVTKEKPGPKFNAAWQMLLASVKKAGAGKKPKSIGNVTAQGIADASKNANSLALKLVYAWIERRLPSDQIVVIDTNVRKLERGDLTFEAYAAEMQKVADTVFKSE